MLHAGIISAQDNPSVTGTKDTVPALHYRYNDSRLPYQPTENPSGLNTKLPSNFKKSVEYDPTTNEYIFREKVGKLDYSLPYTMSIPEYQKYEARNARRSYWAERRKNNKTGGGKSSIIPKLNIGGEAFDKIFGTNSINIVPQGSAELIFGVNNSKVNNPSISERLRSTTTFDFQEKIQMNVTGTIGDKMKLGVNYNTEATFDFENKTKLEYTGKDDEIIKKIEAGNVNLPLTGTLITGSQSLFGLKTELQFGKLKVTTVLSQQKGQSSVIEVKGGAQVTNFEVPVDQYDADKHFFLSSFFRSIYESSLGSLPIIKSPIVITRIEVWVSSKTPNFTDARNVVALLDLGESDGFALNMGFHNVNSSGKRNPDNLVNNLYVSIKDRVRSIQNVTAILDGVPNFHMARDYEKMESVRKLTERDYTLNPRLGYISLNSALRAGDVLSVAYEYTYNGKTYSVGELSTNLPTPNTLVTKLIRSSNFTPAVKQSWDLMMKNVYSLNAYQVNKDNFRLDIVYHDDKTGSDINYLPENSSKGGTSQNNASSYILLRKLGLDKLTSNLDPSPTGDGYFDFMEGITINSSNGRIFFPFLEPFNGGLRYAYGPKNKADPDSLPSSVMDKYVYSDLYTSTPTKAKQNAEKNKFKLKGTYQSSVSSDIPLNATNVPQGSVVVTAGGRQLQENTDYTVDYTLGRVKIINPGLLESGTPIKISLESNSLFNMQTKTLIGTHLDYKFSDKLTLGATAINLNERPLTQKVNLGDEPVSNTMLGLNGTYTTKSQFLTNMLDKIPLLSVKDPSTITVDGEFADLVPGTSSAIKGAAYIDDFEGSETTIDLKRPEAWTLASTPSDFPEGKLTTLNNGYNRAKLAWYFIDPIFQDNISTTPPNIKNDKNTQSNNYVRKIPEKEIFKGRDPQLGVVASLPVLNLAFYPNEKGPYNYSTNVDENGNLNPGTTNKSWGGIQREIVTSDFETANVEFIQFWLMDPFLEDKPDNPGANGKLYFDLGNVSEDVLKDSRKSFENGIPTHTTDSIQVDSTVWGYVSKSQSLVNGFDADQNARRLQDVGLDGLGDTTENRYFNKYIKAIANKVNNGTLEKIKKDPSSDDFHYFKGSDYDDEKLGILDRYKKYNNPEGNSPVISASGDAYSATSLPNSEDINHNNTLDETENFFRYSVDINSQALSSKSNPFIVDSVIKNDVTLANNKITSVKWYQFRIPIEKYQKTVGLIQDFNSIGFMRMFLQGFDSAVILRFAALELVRGEWRKYDGNLQDAHEAISTPPTDEGSFDISAVNIENNSAKSPVNYVLPPGITRQIDPQNPQLRNLNEQAMVLKVNNLINGDSRAAYKNITFDLRQYKHLVMDIHAEALENDPNFPGNGEFTVFLRLGTDYKNNYYEYEVPLELTKQWSYSNSSDVDRLTVWPDSNRMDFDLEDLLTVKELRNSEMLKSGSTQTTTAPFHYSFDGRKGRYSVCGTPNLSNVRTIMIGIRYPQDSRKQGISKSLEVWVNELRLTQFNQKGGWAANLRATTKLSDFGTLTVSGSTIKPGFGSIEKKVSERAKEETNSYNISSNLELGKFFPEKAKVQIPMYVSYAQTIITPQYNPLDPDIELKSALKSISKDSAKKLLSITQDVTTQKSLNFTNVRINKKGSKPHVYDISNFAASYAFTETSNHNINTSSAIDKRYHGSLIYTFQPKPKSITPFGKVKLLKGNAFRLIKDFNFQPYPNNISLRTDMDRTYNEVRTRDLVNPSFLAIPSVRKDFLWNRNYEVGWDLSRSLKLDFNAANYARIDEIPGVGVVDRSEREEYQLWKKTVWENIKNKGRNIHYQHALNATYTVPVNKLPFLEWTSASVRYSATYDWMGAPINYKDSVGNTITNTSSLQVSGQLTFSTLYNKVPYFKRLTQVQDPKKKPKKYKTVTWEKEKTFIAAKQPKVIMHKLSTEDITVKVLDNSGKEIKGKVDVISPNKATFTADSGYNGVKITVAGKIEEKENPLTFILENVTRGLISVKNVSVSWARTGGTTLPGFMRDAHFIGMENLNSKAAPGLPFILGIQDENVVRKALDNKWMLPDNTLMTLTSPVSMMYTENINVRSNIEPIPGFKIELTALRSFTRNQNAYLDNSAKAAKGIRNPIQTGSYSISFLSIRSAFEKIKSSDNFHSAAYDKFKANRQEIAYRMGQVANTYFNEKNPGSYNPDRYQNGKQVSVTDGTNGFNLTSQDVLVPAFMSAYGYKEPGKVTLDKFPSVFEMMPNWRLTYDGLSKLPFLQNKVRTISINHSYRSTYNVGSYIAAPDSMHIYSLDYMLSEYRDIQNNWLPKIDMQGVSIMEQFGPLIGIDVTFKNTLSTKFEIRKSRNIALSMSNSQIIESLTNEIVIGAGYKISDVSFIVKSGANQKGFKSSLNLRADLSVRDNKTIIRPLIGDAQASQGQNSFTLKLSADYVLSDSFNLQMFLNRIVNTPLVSSSYPTANTNVGVSVRFTLAK